MTADIVFLNNNPEKFTKSCLECRLRIGEDDRPGSWYCGFSGFPTHQEEIGNNGCGPEKLYWMPRPLELDTGPPERGFWAKLGDIIIERLTRRPGGGGG